MSVDRHLDTTIRGLLHFPRPVAAGLAWVLLAATAGSAHAIEDDKNFGLSPVEDLSRTSGVPVVPGLGNLFFSQSEFRVIAELESIPFTRYYNSRSPVNEDLGKGWTHSLSDRVFDLGSGLPKVRHADGHCTYFEQNVLSGIYEAEARPRRLPRGGGGGQQLRDVRPPDRHDLLLQDYLRVPLPAHPAHRFRAAHHPHRRHPGVGRA